MKIARLDCLDDHMSTAQRIVTLGQAALKEAVKTCEASLDSTREMQPLVPILLALPSRRINLAPDDTRAIAKEICGAYDGVDRAASRVVDTGHVGFLSALAIAIRLISTQQHETCIVGAADSLVDLEYLHWLENSQRLKAPDVPHGFTAGEGAAFAVVRKVDAVAVAAQPLVRIHSVGFDAEPDLWFEGKATQGQGLTSAIAQAISERQSIDCCYGDLNGETWRSAEWDFAFLRNGRQFRSPLDIRHPAEVWGDTGAASAALNCLLAYRDLLDDLDGHRQALVFASADVQPWRAAVLLERTFTGEGDDSNRYRQ
jgi:3-oxoacyl-[acyl-carrier-protein] synthase I